MKVLNAINAVQAALSKEGISKSRKNQAQGYQFRGIDDMYNVISPLLAEHHLVVLPSYSEREVVERVSAKGMALFYVTVRGDFTFRSSEDQSEVKVGPFYGEAMDSGDKATNKAMSAALKYAFMQTFTIPTEGDNDSENHTHEVASKPVQAIGNSPTAMAKADFESMPKDEQDFLKGIALDVIALLAEDKDSEAYDYLEAQKLDDREKPAMWLTLLDSKQRARIKNIGTQRDFERRSAERARHQNSRPEARVPQ